MLSSCLSESDNLGQIDHFSGIRNLVSFERAKFEDYSCKYRIVLSLLMSALPRWNTCVKQHERWTCQIYILSVHEWLTK